jgi:hypothetical protein
MCAPSPAQRGIAAIVEVELSHIRAGALDLNAAQCEAIDTALTRYLQGECSFSGCQNLLISIVRHDTAVVHLRELLSLSDEPLPFRLDPPDDGLPRRRTHSWTPPEDQRLLGGILRFGLENWQMIAAFIGNGRDRAQCAQRWSRGLNPRICKREWTPQEERHLRDLVAQFGEKRWAKIASILGNRSDVQCRYHYWHTVGGGPARKPAPISAAFIARPAAAPIESTQERGLVVPLSPIAEGIRARLPGLLLESPVKAVPWAVVGSDPESLRSFLGRFQ